MTGHDPELLRGAILLFVIAIIMFAFPVLYALGTLLVRVTHG